ncbi:MAG TPA: hypothetical protein PKX00_23270 [Opitutaceae bacterium]|nr:hypothetical protein [Opitutaceae bacterium]
MHAIDRLSGTLPENGSGLGAPSGLVGGALPPPEWVERFRSALAGEAFGLPASGDTAGVAVAEREANPAPFALLQREGSGEESTGAEDESASAGIDPEVAAQWLQALGSWLPAFAALVDAKVAAPSGQRPAVDLPRPEFLSREVAATLFGPAAGRFETATAGGAQDSSSTNGPLVLIDGPAFAAQAERVAATLPLVAGDAEVRHALSRVGLTPERFTALVPSLQTWLERAPSNVTATLAPPPADLGRVDRDPLVLPVSTPEDPAVTLGTTLLQSLAQQSASAAVAASTPPAPTQESIEKLQSMVAETVSRVLVSDPLQGDRREVRIALAGDVLPQTEIRLWRHENRIHVEFVTTAAVADGGLQEGLPRLAEAIHQRQPQGDAPVLSVRLHDEMGQPGDGRSRQRYQTPEEAEDGA